MKRYLFVFLAAMISVFVLTETTGAGQHTGLWLGTATLKYVSEINKSYADLSFDLGLSGVKANETLIDRRESWAYNDTGAYLDYPGQDWTENPTEKAPYGFGHPDVATTVSTQTTVYFRKDFIVVLPSDKNNIEEYYSNLKVRLWRDDGIVFYLNGQEIFRNNMPTGSIDYDTLALAEIKEELLEFTLPAALLQEGNNWLFVEVYQANSSTDLLFDLELKANLADPYSTELIATETDGWKYDDTDTALSNSWMDHDPSNYDDSGWPTGTAPFGYGGEEGWSGISENTPTAYFRKRFSVSAVSEITHLRLLLLRDDGAAVYVNGTEVLRSNLPSGQLGHDTPPIKAIGAAEEGRYMVVDLDLEALGVTLNDTGTDANVVAVEVHQYPSEIGDSTAGSGVGPTRTSATFDLRLMFHVDGGDAVNLLKEVIQVYDSNSGKYILLTDHALVPNYTGVSIPNGEPMGRHLSAVGFDFVEPHVSCTGAFSSNGTVSCTFSLPSDHSTNPFLHKYHPDHDNLDARYENPAGEAYEVTRTITLNFSNRYPSDEDLPVRQVTPPGWGLSLLGGYYTETFTGLHKDVLTVSGPIVLKRVTEIASLNE